MRSVGERKTVVAAYRTGHAFSCVLALACACLLAVAVALGAPAPAQAASPSISGISNGQVDVATEGVSVSVFFGHNVAAGAIFDANATKFSLRDASGAEVGVSVYRKYNGYGAPDADNPDPEGLRRYIYVSFPSLASGATYTFNVLPGVVSEGGHVFDGASVTFTTKEADSPPDPDPVEPGPGLGEPGTGGTGDPGGDGSGSGGGVATGTDSGDGSGSGAATGAERGTESGISLANAGAASQLEGGDGASESAGDASASGKAASSGAGGGGLAYRIGDAGEGHGFSGGGDRALTSAEGLPRSELVLLAVIASLCAMAGFSRRAIAFRSRKVKDGPMGEEGL